MTSLTGLDLRELFYQASIILCMRRTVVGIKCKDGVVLVGSPILKATERSE